VALSKSLDGVMIVVGSRQRRERGGVAVNTKLGVVRTTEALDSVRDQGLTRPLWRNGVLNWFMAN